MGWWEDLWRPINFGKPDEEKRKQVMNRGYGFSNKDQMGDLYKRSQYTPPAAKPKTAVSNPNFRWPAGELSTSSYDESKRMNAGPDDHYLAAKARMNPNLNPPLESLMPPQEDTGPSLMEQILDRLDNPYGGFKGNVDTSALDAALRAQLGQIGQVRNQTNQNFTTSDQNLLGMHEAARNEIMTKGKERVQDIGNDQLAGLRDIRGDVTSDLQSYKAADDARRMALIKNLGLDPKSALAPSATQDVYNQGIKNVAERGAAEETNASEDLATNLAYNNTVANSIGQQGAQRRAELTQQLQSILGQLGRAEVDANSQYGMAKNEMVQQAQQRDYDMWNQGRQFDLQRYNDLFGQKMQLDDQNFRREQAELDRQAAMAKAMGPMEVPGFGGLAEDLLNTGYEEPDTQRAMQVLSEVLSSDYMNGIPEGYDRTSILARRLRENGINPVIATQLATNYGNLGNVNGYTPLP